MSIESVMPSSHLVFCHSLLLPSIFPSIRVFSMSQLIICFSISPSNEYSRLISFRTDWFDLLAVQGTLKSLLQQHSSKSISSSVVSLLYGPTLTSIHTGKTKALTRRTFVANVSVFNTLSTLVTSFLPRSKCLF